MQTKRKLYTKAILAIFVACLFFILGVLTIKQTYEVRGYVQVAATVTALHGGSYKNHRADFQYTYKGQTYTEEDYSVGPSTQVGTTLYINVDPEHPEKDTPNKVVQIGTVFLMFGLVVGFFATGVYFIRLARGANTSS